MTIEEFIEDRLAEDDEIARHTGRNPAARQWAASRFEITSADEWKTVRASGIQWGPDGVHIARFDPERELEQVATTRRIMDEHHRDGPYCATCCAAGFGEMDRLPWPCRTVRAIASTWGRHPHFQQEWNLPQQQ